MWVGPVAADRLYLSKDSRITFLNTSFKVKLL